MPPKKPRSIPAKELPRVDAIANRMRQNIDALDSCPGHKFTPGSELYEDVECNVCHGTTKRINVVWYERGLRTGKATAEAITDDELRVMPTLKPEPLTPETLKDLRRRATTTKMLLGLEMKKLAIAAERLADYTDELITVADRLNIVGEQKANGSATRKDQP